MLTAQQFLAARPDASADLTVAGWTVQELDMLFTEWPALTNIVGARHFLIDVLAFAQATRWPAERVRRWLPALCENTGYGWVRPRSLDDTAWKMYRDDVAAWPHMITDYTTAAGGDEGLAMLAVRARITCEELLHARHDGTLDRAAVAALAALAGR